MHIQFWQWIQGNYQKKVVETWFKKEIGGWPASAGYWRAILLIYVAIERNRTEMIAIIDYDAGNLKSVEKALQFLGEEGKCTRDAQEILNADKVILPGVGAFGEAMEKLGHFGLIEVLQDVVKRDIPFLGICLGLQLMFESSEEAPGIAGLSLLPGKL